MSNSYNKKIKAVVAGGAGYTGGELIRLILTHPFAELTAALSNSQAGKYIYEIHEDLIGDTDLKFTSELPADTDVLFLCMGHGDSKKYITANTIPAYITIIDLSQDYRLVNEASDRTWVYGLPEKNRESIYTHKSIANPGCFATSIELGLLPLIEAGYTPQDIYINGTTGSTGAGQAPSETTHFSWRSNNLSVYKAFDHQHLAEISRVLNISKELIKFIPMRGAFPRGILSNIQFKCPWSEEELIEIYTKYYETHPFVYVSRKDIQLKQVVNTNKCLLQIRKHGEEVLVTSIIDNLLKGASGQAVQNMNLAFGFPENSGLQLKAVVY